MLLPTKTRAYFGKVSQYKCHWVVYCDAFQRYRGQGSMWFSWVRGLWVTSGLNDLCTTGAGTESCDIRARKALFWPGWGGRVGSLITEWSWPGLQWRDLSSNPSMRDQHHHSLREPVVTQDHPLQEFPSPQDRWDETSEPIAVQADRPQGRQQGSGQTTAAT